MIAAGVDVKKDPRLLDVELALVAGILSPHPYLVDQHNWMPLKTMTGPASWTERAHDFFDILRRDNSKLAIQFKVRIPPLLYSKEFDANIRDVVSPVSDDIVSFIELARGYAVVIAVTNNIWPSVASVAQAQANRPALTRKLNTFAASQAKLAAGTSP